MNKLVSWDERNGEILGLQEGAIDETVIKFYKDIGERAAFFPDFKESDFHQKFMHRERLIPRPQMFAQIDKRQVRGNGEDPVKIIGAPMGATVTVRFGQHTFESINDGVIHFAPPFPGLWIIDIEMPFPNLPQRFEIIAQ